MEPNDSLPGPKDPNLPSYVFKIHFSIILPFMSSSKK